MAKIVIAGDIFPYKDNGRMFKQGDAVQLFGEKLVNMFSTADFSMVNLEGSLTSSSVKQQKVGPVIKASPQSIHGLKNLGVKGVTLANNHVTDYLREGVEETIQTLKEEGIAYAGAGCGHSELKKSLSLAIDNIRVCFYCVSEEFFNKPYVNIYDEYLVCNDIQCLKSSHDFLIVLYHGGRENFPYPTPSLRKRFRRMADSGADYITAQHTHCIGCEEVYNGSRFLYGQGNFLFSRMSRPINREGLVCEMTLEEDEMKIKYHLVDVKEDGTVRYADKQDLAAFYKRSEEIASDDVVVKKYKEYISSNLKLKTLYLSAFRGHNLKDKIMLKLLPGYYRKYIDKQYDRQQLMRIMLAFESDRMREDVTYMWENIFDNLK